MNQRNFGFVLLLALAVLVWAGQTAAPTYASNCPQELIARINALRAQHGLPPYRADPILMAVAQAHSEYQAAIQQGTHIGPNGDRPRDRVRAAGYGGGATIFVSENIAWGTSSHVSPAWAVQLWTQDAPHLHTMLGENYRDVGAGCASAGGKTYFTVDAAYYVGAPQPPPSGHTPTPAPTVLPVVPVVVATPNPDGSVIHIVRSGQTLLQIALAYGVPLEALLQQNGLTEHSVIYPGQKIVVRPGPSPTPTPSPSATATPTPRPTATARPTVTATPPSSAPGPRLEGTDRAAAALTPAGEAPPGAARLLLWGLVGAALASGIAYGIMTLLDRLEGP